MLIQQTDETFTRFLRDMYYNKTIQSNVLLRQKKNELN